MSDNIVNVSCSYRSDVRFIEMQTVFVSLKYPGKIAFSRYWFWILKLMTTGFFIAFACRRLHRLRLQPPHHLPKLHPQHLQGQIAFYLFTFIRISYTKCNNSFKILIFVTVRLLQRLRQRQRHLHLLKQQVWKLQSRLC